MMARIITIVMAIMFWQVVQAADTPPPTPTPQKDYFESLFDEVEVAKTTPPSIDKEKLYDKMVQNSVAYGILKKFPNLRVGDLEFRPVSKKAVHAPEIKRGQDLIRQEFSSQKPLHYKDVAQIINRKISDPNSSIKDMDWVLMSNAFRTLKAPGASHKAHLLGNFIAEYILLEQIKKQESKGELSPEDRTFLSTLYYDLSQLYEAMYKNDEALFNKARNGTLTLPISPIYRDYDPDEEYLPYDEGFDVPFGSLVGGRLDLLRGSLLYDPYDDLPWGQLIYFVTYDLVDPWFEDEIYPYFWHTYFPYGFTTTHAHHFERQWRHISPHMHHHNQMWKHRHQIDRSFRKLNQVHSRPSSRLNRTIHSANVQVQHTPQNERYLLKNHDIVHSRAGKGGFAVHRGRDVTSYEFSKEKPHGLTQHAQIAPKQSTSRIHPPSETHSGIQHHKEVQINRAPPQHHVAPQIHRMEKHHFTSPQERVQPMQNRDRRPESRNVPKAHISRPANEPSQPRSFSPPQARSAAPVMSAPPMRSAPPAASAPSQPQGKKWNR
jgi:hypothetical protein